MDMETFFEDKGYMGVWHRYHIIAREGIKKDEVMRLYNTWAEIFDEDAARGGIITDVIREERARILTRLSDKKDAKILDLCAGTGLLGVELIDIGFSNVDALDGSEKMLAAAEMKAIYQTLILHWIGEDRIPVDDNNYDALFCGYGLLPGHIEDGTSFSELARIVQSSGRIIFITTINQLHRYEAALEQMVQAGIWKYEVYRVSFSVSGVDEGENESDIVEITMN